MMKTIISAAMVVSVGLLVSACGSSEEASRAEPMPIEESAFGDMTSTIDKARDVEDATKQRMEQLNDALEASESR
ncbi:MAG: hypothetical protein GX535_11715 [Xanthomonadaceae bacterium]|nr:hypothetical protein [Xanthomonadaceae bacterium]